MSLWSVLVSLAAASIFFERCEITGSRFHSCAACWLTKLLTAAALAAALGWASRAV